MSPDRIYIDGNELSLEQARRQGFNVSGLLSGSNIRVGTIEEETGNLMQMIDRHIGRGTLTFNNLGSYHVKLVGAGDIVSPFDIILTASGQEVMIDTDGFYSNDTLNNTTLYRMGIVSTEIINNRFYDKLVLIRKERGWYNKLIECNRLCRERGIGYTNVMGGFRNNCTFKGNTAMGQSRSVYARISRTSYGSSGSLLFVVGDTSEHIDFRIS